MKSVNLNKFKICSLKCRGFTLIEVLISLSILSIIIIALYSTFFLSQKAIGAVDESLIKLQDTRGMLDVLKREVESAFYTEDRPYSVFKIDDRDFYGRQASEVTFTAFSPLRPGLSKITYNFDEDGRRLVLQKKIESAYTTSGDTRSFSMLEEVESFTVEARYRDDWVRTWDSGQTKNIPDEVRITIEIIIGDRQRQVSISDFARLRIGRTP
jgi:general secretion pathway protein J